MERKDFVGAPPPPNFIEISNPTDRERAAQTAPSPRLIQPRPPEVWYVSQNTDSADDFTS